MTVPLAEDWELQQIFLTVVRTGRYGAAAEALGLSPQTVRQRVAEIEAALGAPLFANTAGGLAPTPTAITLAGLAERMAGEIEALRLPRTPRGERPRGVVRISAGDPWAVKLLPTAFAELGRSHPEIRLRLSITPRVESLASGEADIALRLFQPMQKTLSARRLGDARVGLFAHRRYLETHGAPASAADLERHTLIGMSPNRPESLTLAQRGFAVPDSAFRLTIDPPVGLMLALSEGVGIGIGLWPVVALDEDLLPVLPHLGADFEVWLVMHEDQRASAPIRTVFEALADFLEAHLARAAATICRRAGANAP